MAPRSGPLGPGDFIGEISLIDGRPRTPPRLPSGTCARSRWAAPEFLELMERHPAVRHGILVALTDRIRSDERSDLA